MTIARLTRLAWGVVAIASAVACGTTTSSGPPGTSSGGGGVVAEETVGSAGGSFASSDGVLTVAIPAGALGADTKISVVEIASPAPGSIGKTYEIGPSGTQFKTPVTLSFKYAGVDLRGAVESDLRVATIALSEWSPLAGGAVDASLQIVSGTTMHLSPYTLISATHVGLPTDAGGDDASDGGTDSGSDCIKDSVAMGSCINHPPFCQTHPGTVAGTCTPNDGGVGYVVMCCPTATL